MNGNQKVKIKNGSATAPHVIIDVNNQQHYIAPGQEAEVELPGPQAKLMKEYAQNGAGNLVIDGTDPAEARLHARQSAGAPKVPDEHASRAALAAKEAEVM